jgi:uncharacterized SAM-binding protein YcdF (DUF218 family)
MHQLLAVIASVILSPFNWIVVLIVAGYFLRRPLWKKSCRLAALGIFILFGNSFILDRYAKWWEPAPTIIQPGQSYSCGIVAGGFASPDANGNGYFNQTADRFIQVVKLYRLGAIRFILISGGNGKAENSIFREGEWVKGELIAMGIPASSIFTEDRSNDTFDNAIFARKILDSVKLLPPYLLITSALHMPRASMLFKHAGVPVMPFPCNYIAGKGNFSIASILPDPDTLLTWNMLLKETAGYFWYLLRT